MHWSEFHLQDKILTAMLVHGVSFRYQAKYRVEFDHEKSQVFTAEHLERARVAQVREALRGARYASYFMDYEAEQGNLLEVWNWTSDEGKALCAELRDLKGLSQLDEATDPENYYLWAGFVYE